MTRLLRTLTLAAGLTLVSSLALAGPATDYVKAKQETLVALVQKKNAESDKKVAAMFDEMLDYSAMAEASLGSEWAARSDAEKAEFTDLLKKLVRKSYEKNLRKTANYSVEYVREEAADGKVLVATKATNKAKANEEPLRLDYRLAQKDGAWKIVDIITEDVSLVGSYRSQFVKVVKKDGFAALTKKMKDKLAKDG